MDTGPPPLAALPPAIPSEAPVDSGAAQPARPWGFWLTLVFGFFIAMAQVIAQTAVVLAAAITQGKLGDPHAIEALAYNGLVLSIATLLGLPVTVGLVVVFAFISSALV